MFHRKKFRKRPSTLLSENFDPRVPRVRSGAKFSLRLVSSHFLNFLKVYCKNYKIITLGIILSLLIATPVLLAQDATQSADQKCAAELRDYLGEKGKPFLEEIDKHFQNPSSTTSLMPPAIEKYSAYQKMVTAQFDLLRAQIGGGATQAKTLAAFSRCEKELSDHLLMIDKILRDHIKQSSSAKRTFIMTTEYQRINDKMADLNRQVGQLKGYFQVMDSKLENFIPKCVKG